MSPLEPGHEEVKSYFEKLREKIPKLENNPKKNGDESTGPLFFQYLTGEVQKLLTTANNLLEGAASAEAQQPVYIGLGHHNLRELVRQYEELLVLLKGKLENLQSRINTQLLTDQVSLHIDDFDSFAEQRLPRFLQELRCEGSLYCGGVADVSKESPPVGLISTMVLDVAVGVRPGRSAFAVLEHLKRKIDQIESRVVGAMDVLRDFRSTNDSERAKVDSQTREFAVMKESLKRTQELHAALSGKWSEMENRTELNAISKQFDLKELLETKKIAEMQIIEDAQKAHDDLMHVCLPMCSPQFYRRNSMSYTVPCMIKLGYRLYDSESKSFLNVPTLAPNFFPLMRSNHIAQGDYEQMSGLFGSQHEIWVRFDEMPEMVKGSRCALRDVNTVLDHFRAFEEQKEVGGYFMMSGGERIVRALLMQRSNVAINVQREKFKTQGPQFSSKAIIFRSRRPSGLTLQNYFYYTSVGEIVFSFARKLVWHIPVSLLLFSMKADLSPLMLYQLLTLGLDASAQHPARVEALLQHHRSKPYGELDHFVSYLSVLGRMYRTYHQKSVTYRFLPNFHQNLQCQHDAWYGLFVIRRHILPHLNCSTPTPDLPLEAENFDSWLPKDIMQELESKFNVMIHTCRQLYQFVDGKLEHQGNDVPAYQEIFSVSQVLIGAFEVSLSKYLKSFTYRMSTHYTPALFRNLFAAAKGNAALCEVAMKQLRHFTTFCDQRDSGAPLSTITKLLTSGNLLLDREEDFYCPQTSGWVVMAEHLNFFRFFEQFRCIHRGATIANMRSSEVRKYPCEAYGFICMVHSPDGEDCGVLNHLSVSTIVTSTLFKDSKEDLELRQWLRIAVPQMLPHDAPLVDRLCDTVAVWFDGNVIGYLPASAAISAVKNLRYRKSIKNQKVVNLDGVIKRADVSLLNSVEVVYVPNGSKDPAGIYIFSDGGRLMRPIQQIESTFAEVDIPFPIVYVGTWEQTWLDIASVPSDLADAKNQLNKKYEYMEQNGSNIISFTSTTIPFFEYNCSPRNLFQCGLSKQSSGTQLQAMGFRKEPKLFRMYCPQRYISRTIPMDYYGLDEVSLGVNAVIAILAYTGYDLDDAVILNHTAQERGMLDAGITVSKVITANSKLAGDDDLAVFHNVHSNGWRESSMLDDNGLPRRRAATYEVDFDRDHKFPPLRDDTPVYCCATRCKYSDPIDGSTKYRYINHNVTRWRHFDKGENAWVQNVVPLTFDGPDVTSALVVFRIPRPPTVGDKFSSRHGQKGTLPLHIRAIDLPFSAKTGLTPDVIINPHAFPSRMTVGMVLEIMAAKIGSIEGRFIDNSAWSVVDSEPRCAEQMGEELVRLGFNRYGREPYIDGISGEMMEADVFCGVSGYQRLRHMVSDKWQARSRTDHHTFRAVTKTGQPVKGRKRHGGVRVGEMERDGLLSHGIAEVVVDRLLHVSDKTKAFVCVECGGLLSIYEKFANNLQSWKACKFCGAGNTENTDTIAMVDIPQVLRLWATELTGVGVRVSINVS